ncbi:hypothetical protein [Streptomyces sp. NPDC050504]|uniref:hypothetical protein n=1 Tax=Streptomyces sp. NPDC050504 TaxID=3365618 RepID=UPI0037B5916F
MHELELRVDPGPGAAPDQLARQVNSLYQDLRRLGVLRVARKTADAPDGSMAGAGQELGVLVLSGAFSAAAIKALGNVLVAYVQRSKARGVEWRIGEESGTYTALSAKDQHLLVQAAAARIAAGDGSAVATTSDDSAEPGDGHGGAPHRTAGSD